jgi:hypothetical protein
MISSRIQGSLFETSVDFKMCANPPKVDGRLFAQGGQFSWATQVTLDLKTASLPTPLHLPYPPIGYQSAVNFPSLPSTSIPRLIRLRPDHRISQNHARG